jgi:hypothetical protein
MNWMEKIAKVQKHKSLDFLILEGCSIILKLDRRKLNNPKVLLTKLNILI